MVGGWVRWWWIVRGRILWGWRWGWERGVVLLLLMLGVWGGVKGVECGWGRIRRCVT